MTGSTWTTERHEQLCVLVAEGKSGGQIATEMGGLTRSAVMGRMNRNNIKSKNPCGALNRTNARPKRAKRPKGSDGGNTSAIKAKRRMNEGPDRAPILPQFVNASLDEFNSAIPVSQRVTLIELTNETCRFPLWESDSRDGLYCGALEADHEERRPFCSFHARIAYRPTNGAGHL